MAVTAIKAVLERLDAVQHPLDALDALSIGPSVRACTPRVESVQDTLTNTAHGLDTILARTRVWRNMLAQVNRLSDELLARVFLLVCDDAREQAGPWPGCAVARVSVRLAHVCSRWRRVAFRGAALWTDVQLPQTVDPGDCDRLLTLSNDLPCSVSIVWRDVAASNSPAATSPGSPRAIEYADAVLPALQAHAERLLGFSVVFDKSYSDAVLKVLAITAPRLSQLCIGHHLRGPGTNTIPGDGGRTVFTSPLPLDMPVLSHLSLNALDSSILPSFCGTSLHELCLRDMEIQGSDLGGVLTRNTTLRSLSLRSIGLRGPSPLTRWAVPELHSLVVSGLSSDSLTVLRRSIALSHIASIDMTYDPIGALIGYHNTRRVDFPWAAYLLSGIGDVHTVKLHTRESLPCIEATSAKFRRVLSLKTGDISDVKSVVEYLWLDSDATAQMHVHMVQVTPETWNVLGDVVRQRAPQTPWTLVIDLSALLSREQLWPRLLTGKCPDGDVVDLEALMRYHAEIPCVAVTAVHVVGALGRSLSPTSLAYILDLLDFGGWQLDQLSFSRLRVDDVAIDTHRHRARNVYITDS